MMNETLIKAVNEKDVENTYRHNFLKKFKDMEISSPFGCDGFGVSKSSNLRVLMEFKDDLNLTNKLDLVKVLAQSVFYVKKFYDKGLIPPSTIFVGDRNECLALHVNDLITYLEMDLNWNSAPSSAHNITELITRLIKDENIKPFVYDSKDFLQCIDKIKDLTDNVQRKVLVTDKNITEVFRYFDEKVLGKNKLTTNERANLFVQILVNKDDNYLHPVNKRKTVVTKSFGEVSIVSRDAFQSFFGHFSTSYTPSQKHKLAAVVDRIVEDTTRRKQGEFFTPAIWVDKAHEYIASVFGEDWKEKYVVWDPAWGTGNLTRDYKFKELYVSTLNQSDIDTANQMGYNPEAVKFQYDFMNDSFDKLPIKLREAIQNGKKIIMLMNPPYGRSTGGIYSKNEYSRNKLADSIIQKEMLKQGFGKSTQQMYSQFLFLSKKYNCEICVFSSPTLFTGESFKSFREKFLINYSFDKGFVIDASQFADVQSWPLTFSIFSKKNSNQVNSNDEFIFDVLINNDFEVSNKGTKTFYNHDYKKKLKELYVEKNKKKINFPGGSSPLNVREKHKSVFYEDSIGYFVSDSNSVKKSLQDVAIFTMGFSRGQGNPISKNNLLQVCSAFTARKIVVADWLNGNDEFLFPTRENELFEKFQFDSLIISLFESKSNQSSLRQVEYKDQLWDIKNEFFWMSADKLKELADQNGYDELYNDARTSSERHVYKLLFGEERIYDKLSPDAKAVLDKATELVERSMELRQVMANDENHLNSWDAGYAQLKLVWKEYFQEEFKEFRQLYKALEDRMRPLVYELGFLKK